MQSKVRLRLSEADPRAKLVWFVVIGFATLLPLGSYTFVLLIAPLIAFGSGLHRSAPWLSLVGMPLFLLVIGIANLLTSPAPPVQSAFLVIRWAAMIYGALFFVSAMRAQETRFLMRWTRLPTGFGIALFFALRTVPTALEQLRGLIRAMQARGLWPLSWSLRQSVSVIRVLPELLLAMLFAGAERTDQMWVALELRGGWANAPVVLSESRSTAATVLLTGHTLVMIGLMIIIGIGILK